MEQLAINAVIFDVDDSLYIEKDYIKSGFTLLAKKLIEKAYDADAEQMYNCFEYAASPAIEKYLRSKNIYSYELHQELLALHREHIPNIRPYPHLEKLLLKLKKHGIKLGIISDGTPLAQKNKVLGLKLYGYFDYCVFSDSLGGTHCRKPCDVSFRYIQKLMNLEFSQMLYIGDNCTRDFYPVDHLGMHGIQIRDKRGVYYGQKYKNSYDNYADIHKKIFDMLGVLEMPISITIDGPVGAGKTSIAKAVANRLEIIHLDTGAMYRTLAYACCKYNIDTDNAKSLENFTENANIGTSFDGREQINMLDGENVNAFIRQEHIGMLASKISKNELVRQKLVKLQRDIAKKYDIILDGRDTGSNVLKDADVKIYLTADAKIRAQRRYEQNGKKSTVEIVLKDLMQRDKQDMTREVNPLVIPENAYIVDSSDQDEQSTVDTIVNIIRSNYEPANR